MSFWNTCILAYCRLGIAGLSPKAPGTAGSALAALPAPAQLRSHLNVCMNVGLTPEELSRFAEELKKKRRRA